MKYEKLKYPITNGPNLHQLFQSLGRNTDKTDSDVTFTFTDIDRKVPLAEQKSDVIVMIQGLERPQNTGFWKIRAACIDIAVKHMREINVLLIYSPDNRKGYLDFTFPQPSRLCTVS